MFKVIRLVTVLLIGAVLLLAVSSPSIQMFAAPHATTAPVNLGTAVNFAVLAGSAVNDTTLSAATGSVGLSPAAWPPAHALTCG